MILAEETGIAGGAALGELVDVLEKLDR